MKWWRAVGTMGTLQWLCIRLSAKLCTDWPKAWRLHPREVEHALRVRLRGSSDLSVFFQIFIRQEYSILRNLEDVSLVLDLGANVGYSSAYFLNCFPNARVIAVEPDDRNVDVCRINLRPYGKRALTLQGAAWSECTKLCLSRGAFGDKREWATQVVEPPELGAGYVQAWDVGSLIDLAGSKVVDLLKVDIEQAELAVFSETARNWLQRVRNICIELHGAQCTETFFNALKGFNYELGYSGEMTICKNIRAMAAPIRNATHHGEPQASDQLLPRN